MLVAGIELKVRNIPELDRGFIPFAKFLDAFEAQAKSGVDAAVSLERENGKICLSRFKLHGTEAMHEADKLYLERLVKFLLYAKGGFRLTIYGAGQEIEALAEYIRSEYAREGQGRAFDAELMRDVYEREFEVLYAPLSAIPNENDEGQKLGGNLNGCRIGFDAGGSDRKVSAVIDGEAVFSEEVVWHPKTQSDPKYHYEGILSAFREAAKHMPRVDAIGVSSAGLFVANRCMRASLFIKVPPDAFEREVKEIYLRAAKEFGAPISVCNDGDVAALAGTIGLKDTGVLGIAMGTSEAGGFVDQMGNIRGWLNELAFAPVDLNPRAAVDPWSGDKGVGAMYFSQDAVIKLAPEAGIAFDEDLSPADKLKLVQGLMAKGDARARAIFASIGVYLGHALALYHRFYGFKHALMMGRVMSGGGGDLILETAKKVLADEYPGIQASAELPDEMTRRVGQSVAAASLPEV